jgi:hypothetical protein
MRPEKHFGENFPLLFPRALIYRRENNFQHFALGEVKTSPLFSVYISYKRGAPPLFCVYMPLICALCCSRATVVCALLRKSLIQRGEYSFFLRHFSFESLAQDVRRYHANQTSRLHFKDDGVQPSNGNGQIIRLLSTKELTKAQHAFQSAEQLSGFDARLPLLCFCAPVVCVNQMHCVSLYTYC